MRWRGSVGTVKAVVGGGEAAISKPTRFICGTGGEVGGEGSRLQPSGLSSALNSGCWCFFFLMVICVSEQVGYHTCLTDDFITFVFQICSLVVISFQVFQNVTEEWQVEEALNSQCAARGSQVNLGQLRCNAGHRMLSFCPELIQQVGAFSSQDC